MRALDAVEIASCCTSSSQYVSYEKAQGSSRSKADQGARLICGTKGSICTEKVPSQIEYGTVVMKGGSGQIGGRKETDASDLG
ncbi:uncharacterized protein PgNI_08543 [Pyricularia grisea]|uniref:Uncharacterized protein n=1 Tax=Pyricularia grisea TaxID=148305 RepID=A0A6P8AWH8_PYRGI|nr:uncharacterized protein PgNI_08543 [Pyricularia grisea]TLD06529.1 hypothetical protein PgNI_08543 [Pyricularia grisea]